MVMKKIGKEGLKEFAIKDKQIYEKVKTDIFHPKHLQSLCLSQ